jgi:hypothetical protein
MAMPIGDQGSASGGMEGSMETFIRIINVLFGPVLTLFFAAKFDGIIIAGKNAGEVLGAAAAAAIVLTIEIALIQGPKYSTWLRRWLDQRAAFEGFWLQDVIETQGDNVLGVFSLDYDRDKDSFNVVGRAYAADAALDDANFADVLPSREWRSTHMFIERLKASYRWKGDVLKGVESPVPKEGLTDLELRGPPPPSLALPMVGQGRVTHIGEPRTVAFGLRRITNRQLKKLGLSFTMRKLRLNAHNEETALVQSFLRRRAEERAKGRALAPTAHRSIVA